MGTCNWKFLIFGSPYFCRRISKLTLYAVKVNGVILPLSGWTFDGDRGAYKHVPALPALHAIFLSLHDAPEFGFENSWRTCKVFAICSLSQSWLRGNHVVKLFVVPIAFSFFRFTGFQNFKVWKFPSFSIKAECKWLTTLRFNRLSCSLLLSSNVYNTTELMSLFAVWK